MSRAVLLLCLLCVSACGVQGELYRPNDAKPDPSKRERNQKTYPFPQQAPDEQEIMPDLI